MKTHFFSSNEVEVVSTTPTGAFHVVLYQPEIPPNTGTIIRLCAATSSPLHLIGPLGFRLDAPGLRRAGMDYRDLAQISRWRDWEHYQSSHPQSTNRLAISTKGDKHYGQWSFRPGDHLLFGSEGSGLPDDILQQHRPNLLRIPMTPGCRSLNLAMSVGIVLYEALRQNAFPSLNTGADPG
ncbi:MAG: tRNA/rRNA methyltransferase (SpoU) [Magnetococcales bacterium]|nr:tRNA/rRNA methyltransferase (SpoU) [Magnetococcales bacterium]HIJ85523.1 tRNA (cytidine(34)-2'-O)-methyltransferase [Magnetococcales bacterium]